MQQGERIGGQPGMDLIRVIRSSSALRGPESYRTMQEEEAGQAHYCHGLFEMKQMPLYPASVAKALTPEAEAAEPMATEPSGGAQAEQEGERPARSAQAGQREEEAERRAAQAPRAGKGLARRRRRKEGRKSQSDAPIPLWGGELWMPLLVNAYKNLPKFCREGVRRDRGVLVGGRSAGARYM